MPCIRITDCKNRISLQLLENAIHGGKLSQMRYDMWNTVWNISSHFKKMWYIALTDLQGSLWFEGHRVWMHMCVCVRWVSSLLLPGILGYLYVRQPFLTPSAHALEQRLCLAHWWSTALEIPALLDVQGGKVHCPFFVLLLFFSFCMELVYWCLPCLQGLEDVKGQWISSPHIHQQKPGSRGLQCHLVYTAQKSQRDHWSM